MELNRDKIRTDGHFRGLEEHFYLFYFEVLTEKFKESNLKLIRTVNELLGHLKFFLKPLFTQAYRYLKTVGFPSLPKTFWTNSVFARVWSKDMICQPPAAIDMRDGEEFR